MDSNMQADLRADIELLLECIKCQIHSPAAVKQALLTIASMCTTQEDTKDILRKHDGLKFILDILTSGSDICVKEAAMFALGCAVESNVFSQKQLCRGSMFDYLHKMLGSHQSGVRLIQSASFLILALTTNNSMGQTLVRKSECLNTFLELFKSALPTSMPVRTKQRSTELWTSVTSALSACVNNPQNEENQRLCSKVFPHAYQLLQDGTEPHVLRPLASFLGLTVANNVHNQDRAEQCGVLEVLISAIDRVLRRSSRYNTDLQLAVALTNTIDTIITDHPRNVTRCGSLGGVALFLQLLQTELEPTAALQVVLTLAHCTDDCQSNQHDVVAQGGIPILIQRLSHVKDEALSDSIRYVLQTCVHAAGSVVQHPTTLTRTNLKSGLIAATEEKNPETETVSQFADVIKRRLDSLEASLLSVQQRTSEAYSGAQVNTTGHAAAIPTTLSRRSQVGDQWSADITTNEMFKLLIAAKRGDKPPISGQNAVPCRQVGTSTGEDSVGGLNEWKQGTRLGCRHTETDREDTSVGCGKDRVSSVHRQVATHTGDRADMAEAHLMSTYTQVGNYARDSEGYGKTDPCEREMHRHKGNYSKERKILENVDQCKKGDYTWDSYGKTDPYEGKSWTRREIAAVPEKNTWPPQRTSATVCWTSSNKHITRMKTVALQTNFTPCRPVAEGSETDLTVNPQRPCERTMSVCRSVSSSASRDMTGDLQGLQERTTSVCSPAVARTNSDPTGNLQTPHERTMSVCCETAYRTNKDLQGSHERTMSEAQTRIDPIEDMTSQDKVATDVLNEELQEEQALRESLQTELDRTILALSQRDSGQCRKTDHAAQLTAELQRQQKEQEEKDRQSQKTETVQARQEHMPVGERRQQSNFPARHQVKPTTVHQSQTTSHKQPGIKSTHSGMFARVSPQLATHVETSSTPRRRLCQRATFGSENRSTSLQHSEHESSGGKTTSKNRKMTVAVKSQPYVSMSATTESDHDGVFRKPSLPLRRGRRGTSASSCPREPQKRRLFAADKLKLQPVVLLRPLVSAMCIKQSADPCPSPAQSEFDLKLLKAAAEDTAMVRPPPGQCRRTRVRSAGGEDDDSGNWTHKQSTNGRLDSNRSRDSVNLRRQLSRSYNYSTGDDTDSDTSEQSAWVKRAKHSVKKLDNLRCPGCQPPEQVQDNILNSYTYNIALETSSGTCHAHRQIRQAERRVIHAYKQSLPCNRCKRRLLHTTSRRSHVNRKPTRHPVDVFQFPSDASSSETVSPPSSGESVTPVMCHSVGTRRPRVDYKRQEEDNLMNGVERYGRSWNQILHSYVFHPTRTAMDLKEKYRRLVAKCQWTPEPAEKTVTERRPFSMAEERRLRRGVHCLGYNWKAIQGAYQFAKGRSATELRNKWRSMHRPKLLHRCDATQ